MHIVQIFFAPLLTHFTSKSHILCKICFASSVNGLKKSTQKYRLKIADLLFFQYKNI